MSKTQREELRNLVAKTAGAGISPDMVKINVQALRTLTENDVFAFKIAACNTLVDRDCEHFSKAALEDMADLYVGKTVLFDHSWSASKQTARIYDATVENLGGFQQLLLYAYTLRTEAMQPVIDAIEGGILREVSVGCAVKRCICDICGHDYCGGECNHIAGKEYDGTACTVTLDGCTDVYEVSFVAVPAQPKAGVTKKLEKDADGEAADPSAGDGRAETKQCEIPQDELDALALEAVRYP